VNRLLAFLLTPVVLLSKALALDLPAGGTEIGTGALQASANAKAGKVEPLQPGQRITITHADEAKSYSAQFTAPIGSAVAKNERVFAILKARVVGEFKVGEVLAKLQLKGAPYSSFGSTIGIGLLPEWTELPVTFIATESIPANTAAVVLLCGHKAQSIEVASVRVLKYPASTDITSFPKVKPIKRTYPGREAEAPWRAAALARSSSGARLHSTLRRE
jgi:hypothetical protein